MRWTLFSMLALASAFTLPMPIQRVSPPVQMQALFMSSIEATGAQASSPSTVPPATLYDPLEMTPADLESEADVVFSEIDANGDGSISNNELRDYLLSAGYAPASADKLFDLFDTDADGQLSLQELREAFARYEEPEARKELLRTLNTARVHADADSFFAAIDEDGDGSISSAELGIHLSQIGYAETATEKFFEVLDVNSDGGISRQELREAFVRYEDPALRAALGLGTAEADTIFDRIDTDSDGQLSKAEVCAYLEEKGFDTQTAADTIFKTLDADDNGTISRDELRNGCVRYSALREALGLRSSAKVGRRKKQPIRWGRGNRKGSSL